MPTKFKIIIALVITALIGGGAFYFNSQMKVEKRKVEPQLPLSDAPADSKAPIPMRILINTSEGSSPTIDGEAFMTGEWRHMSEKWFQKNAEALKKYPDIKEARIILEEKLAGVPEENLKQVIKENNLQSFAQGLKDAAIQYNESLPAIADTILKITPYEK